MGFGRWLLVQVFNDDALTVLKKGDAAEVEAVRGEVEAVREWAEGFLSKFTTKP